MGLAVINRFHCAAWIGTTLCRTCYDKCPYAEKAIRLDQLRPVIDEAVCTGCGICTNACPGCRPRREQGGEYRTDLCPAEGDRMKRGENVQAASAALSGQGGRKSYGRLRLATLTGAFLLIAVNPFLNFFLHLDFIFIQGWYQSFGIGKLWFVSPLEGLESLLVTKSVYGPSLFGMVIPLMIALYLGRKRSLRVHVRADHCNSCGRCARGCPMGLRPNAGEGLSAYCWNCGDCVDTCRDDALHFRWL